MSLTESFLVAVDVGGTFTDLVAVSGSRFVEAKVPSTPADPGLAVVEGLERLVRDMDATPSAVSVLLHGTTVATNAVLQRRGARTALLTTRGFRDVLEIARQARPRLFSFDARRPEPLVPRHLRLEISERMSASGEPIEALDKQAIEGIATRLLEAGIEAVAISFLHSYANPTHEERAAQLLRDACPSIHVSISSQVVSEYREYERTSTTTVNSFVAPVMSRYLGALGRRLRERGVPGPMRVMQSNGGLMSAERAERLPVATVLSGVAAGAIGGIRIAHSAGRALALTLDMGGTSCDLALGVDGEVMTSRAAEVGGLPVRIPALDVHTIGAGGGSIAHVDPGGALQVGPRSAGADPGPAAYGRGGTEPTVTDANAILGRLPERGLIGGALPLNLDLARNAVRRVAEPLGLSIEDAAAGIIRVVNAAMARQMRVLTVERGVDPRECSLVAFGGSGPVHAAELAAELGMREVIVPPTPGVTSALGLVLADAKYDRVQTVLLELDGDAHRAVEAANRLEQTFGSLERALRAELAEVAPHDEPTVLREVEIRYRRQGHELRVTAPGALRDAAALQRVIDDFHEAHRTRFGYALTDEAVVIVNALVTLSIPSAGTSMRRATPDVSEETRTTRPVWFGGRFHDTTIVPRSTISTHETLVGPAIIEQLDSTTVVPPGVAVTCDAHDNLVLRLND